MQAFEGVAGKWTTAIRHAVIGELFGFRSDHISHATKIVVNQWHSRGITQVGNRPVDKSRSMYDLQVIDDLFSLLLIVPGDLISLSIFDPWEVEEQIAGPLLCMNLL